MTVVDLFCGAGGFSEGFRQLGFEIILGIDKWETAIKTFKYNQSTKVLHKNILELMSSTKLIESLPDSDIIIGSPPCVSFSSSNKSGKADKSLGLRLTEAFLRFVVIKKYKRNSILKGWFMENVPNSIKYLKDEYSFEDLDLSDWALKNGLPPHTAAITVRGNYAVLNSADYGSFQARKRVILGEYISTGKFIPPPPTHSNVKGSLLPSHKKIKHLWKYLPSPFNYEKYFITDPNYKFRLRSSLLSDHFYDTGIYKNQWIWSKEYKVSHPFMGKMAFPENINKPSRTIMATKIVNSREALIYKCELPRIGDGEYRSPTTREAACIMGFPISYQFWGSEKTKWRLLGNAVCPSVSSSIAREIYKILSLNVPKPNFNKKICLKNVNNLNDYKIKDFQSPPVRNQNSRFRRHPFKIGNMTVTLSNYSILNNDKIANDKWFSSIQYGTGKNYGIQEYREDFFNQLEPIIINSFKDGQEFIKKINNGFSEKIGSAKELQIAYETGLKPFNQKLSPYDLIEELSFIINNFSSSMDKQYLDSQGIFLKEEIPKKQLFALYAINKIISIANNS